MTNYAWFQLLIRAIGVLLIGLAMPYVLYPIQTIAVILEREPYVVSLSSKIASVAFSLGLVSQLLFGTYLLFGGKRIVMRCIAAVDGHCAACGYDLRGLNVTKCPECGLGTGPGQSDAREVNDQDVGES